LLLLTEAISGQVLDKQGVMEQSKLNRTQTLDQIRQRLNAESEDDDWIVWGRWFVSDPSTRTVSPFSKITVPEYIQNRIQEKTDDSLYEADQLAIGNTELLQRISSARKELEEARKARLLEEQARRAVAQARHAGAKEICGYRIDNDSVVFDFDPRVFFMTIDHDAQVLVAGEFNSWLDADNGRITKSYPEWVMQRIDENHYTLRKKITELQGGPQLQFKFVVNCETWSEPPPGAINWAESGGFENLVLTIP
jgi:hypothetical protein